MSTTVEEIYSSTIRPLPDKEKLEIASIILDEVTGKTREDKGAQKKGDISKFFGIFENGDPTGSDNEKIDADLARAYSGELERQD